MDIKRIAELDSKVASRLKLSNIQHFIARTSAGDLYLTYKKDGNHQFFLDSVPLDKDTNKDLLNLYDGRLYTTEEQIDILGWLSRLDSEVLNVKTLLTEYIKPAEKQFNPLTDIVFKSVPMTLATEPKKKASKPKKA